MSSRAVAPTPVSRLHGFADVLRAESCKLRTVRSTFWTLCAAMVFTVGFAALAAIFIPSHLTAQDRTHVDAIRLSLAGLHLSQIAVGALGVLVITSEYGTGMIRATFSAVPQRRRVLAAKLLVLAGTALVVGVVSSFGAYFVFEACLSGDTLRSTITDPGVFRAVTGGGLYLAVLALLGLGLGTIIRASSGAIAALFGLLFIPPILTNVLPQVWQSTIGPYVPMEAGSQIFVAVHHEPGSLGPWTGFGVFSLYAVAALTVGFLLIGRRDA